MRAAALAVLGLVFTAPVAAAPCDIWAYVTDEDPNGLNIRGGPGASHRIVGVVKKDPHESIVHITKISNGWARIDKSEGLESGKRFVGTGWVSLKLVAIGTRGYEGNGVPAYKNAGTAHRVIGVFRSESEVQHRDCRGDWAYVRDGKGREGWLAPADSCATALTTCS